MITTSSIPEDLRDTLSTLIVERLQLSQSDLSGITERLAAEPLKGDGSSRRFWRISIPDVMSGIAIAPEKLEKKCFSEAASVWQIGNHLRSAGISVPELYGYDRSSGVLLCEDLGENHLHDFAVATDFSISSSVEKLRCLYRQTLDVLVAMQIEGGKGFDQSWCWDTSRYDRQLMLERESGYFLRAFWQGLLAQETPVGLETDFATLADIACQASTSFFLHRDFQSRNVMITDGQVRIIDFQGGRLGPLGYDLASLLRDPYAALPQWFQDELYLYYLECLHERIAVEQDEFHRHYNALALQRNLQILGAFAYLSAVSGKTFFRSYINPALTSLRYLITTTPELELPVLTAVAKQAVQLCSDSTFS